jgi:hypothetical protein
MQPKDDQVDRKVSRAVKEKITERNLIINY